MTNRAGNISKQFAPCDPPIRQDLGYVPQAIDCKPHATEHEKQTHSDTDGLSLMDIDSDLTLDHPTKPSIPHNRVSSAPEPQQDPRQLSAGSTTDLDHLSCDTTSSGDKTLRLSSHLATHEGRCSDHITPPASDSRFLSITQLANYYHTIIAEIHNFYGAAGLYQRRYPQAPNSVFKVVSDALASPKRLFLHKLRNELCTTPSGFYQYQNALIPVLPPAKAQQAKATCQVQALYIYSKFDRVQGLYRPLKHELLSNFAWLYAGLKNGALSKKAKPKAINLMLANPTNLPQNSKIDADKLFRKGIRAKGLSALGYELSFLLAANFKVQRPKLDISSGLTKIRLTPPDSPSGSFDELLRKSASGFLQPDYKQPEARARDVENFLNAARKNSDWLNLLEGL